MYELSNRDLDGIDIELGRYRTLANKIYLRRQELIHNKKHSLSLIHISEPTRRLRGSRMPSSA